jgi:hypothetical protein
MWGIQPVVIARVGKKTNPHPHLLAGDRLLAA